MTSPVCGSSIAICWNREWKSHPIISILGSFLPSLGQISAAKFTRLRGADAVIQSTNGILGHWDLSLANFREPDFRDLAAKSASAAVFACLDGMYSEDDASS